MEARSWGWRAALVILALAPGLMANLAWGEEQLGVVKSVDSGRRTAVLADGTRLWLVPGLSLDLFAQGRRIKVVYEERDGKKWVRSVEAID
jgi:hypothetical protein